MLKNRLLMGGLFLVLIAGGVIFYQELIAPQQIIGQVKKDKPTGLEDDDEFWKDSPLDDEFDEIDELFVEEPEIDIAEMEDFYRDFDRTKLFLIKKFKEMEKEDNIDEESFEEFLKVYDEVAKYWEEMLKLKQLKQQNPEEFERLMEQRRRQKPDEHKNPSRKPEGDQRRPKQPPFGPEGPGDKQGPPPPEMMPAQEINEEEVIAFLKEFHPELAKELNKLREKNPEMYEERLRHHYFEMMHLRGLKKNNPQMYERIIHQQRLERELRELAEKYHQSKDEKERESIKKQIRSILEKIFGLMEQNASEDIKRMEKEVNKLKEKLARKQAERDKLIEDRLKEIIGEKEGWDWR